MHSSFSVLFSSLSFSQVVCFCVWMRASLTLHVRSSCFYLKSVSDVLLFLLLWRGHWITHCIYRTYLCVFVWMRGFVLACVSVWFNVSFFFSFLFFQTLRGGLWSSWVLLLRPFLFSCIRLHLVACWLLARDPPASWEPASLACPFWPFWVFWLFLGAWLLNIPFWVFWLSVGSSTVRSPAWSHGRLRGGLACCFWAVGAKALGCNAELDPPALSGLPWLLLLGVFTLFCLRSFFHTLSQNSSTLFSSGWSKRDRKSRYHILCLAEWPAPPPAPGIPGRMSPNLWVGMTWRLRRSRGWIKPCSTAWQW